MNEQLKKLLEYLLEEELEEQNALVGGAIAGGSAASALNPADFHPPPKSKLEEVNTVSGYFGVSNSEGLTSIPEEDQDFERPLKKAKRFKFRKSEKGYNPTADTMWNYGDKPIYNNNKAGILPANKVKYIALEEIVSLDKTPKKVKIYQDKGHPVSQQSLNVLIDFLKFCNSILKLENMPDIYLHMIKKPEMTTGMYNRGNHIIHVLFGKRLLVDVMRTIAHELTHARQEETGLLDKHLANVDPMDEMGDIDTIYENEAYTLAGNIVKIFCRKYKRIPKDELYQLNENKRWL